MVGNNHILVKHKLLSVLVLVLLLHKGTGTLTSFATTGSTDTTEPTAVAWMFSKQCNNNSVYYLMRIMVTVNESVSDYIETNTTWLESLFQQPEDKSYCATNASSATPSKLSPTFTSQPSELTNVTHISTANTSGNFSSTLSVQNVSSVTATQFHSWTSAYSTQQNETSRLFLTATVTCDNKTGFTGCTVLLLLKEKMCPNYIASKINQVQNFTIQGEVVRNQTNQMDGWTSENCTLTTACVWKNFSSFSMIETLSKEIQAQILLCQSTESKDVDIVITSMEKLLSGTQISQILANTCINIINNLLNASVDKLANFSTRIIKIVETVGWNVVEDPYKTTFPFVALAVTGTFNQTSFTMINSSNLQIGGSAKATSVLPQGSITIPISNLNNLSLQQQHLASRILFVFYQEGTLFQDKTLNPNKSRLISGVLGCSVANQSISNLKENVTITLRNNETFSANFLISCVFWNFNLNDGSGGWSLEGCTVQSSTENETVCSCNHLTYFGILLGIMNTPSIGLTYITYIGCVLSIICLSITVLTYLAFEKLRQDVQSNILIHMCFALLLLNLVFLLDMCLAKKLEAVGLCFYTALFLHYFLLASFTWMALQAAYMYLIIVKVFNAYFSHFMIKMGLAGWGIPLIVIVTVLAVDTKIYELGSYGQFDDGSTDYFCWLKNKTDIFAAVMGYFCVTYLLTFSMFIVVMVLICRIKRKSPQYTRKRSVMQDLRSVTAIVVLLGLTWGFAFFAWGPVNETFNYLFTIFNSLQGFFIFIFHCVAKEEVRNQWRKYLCCAKCREGETPEKTTKIFSGIMSIFSRFRISFSPRKAQNTINIRSRNIISFEPDIAGSSTTVEFISFNEIKATKQN